MSAPLSDSEQLRYHRQIALRGFDFEGQEKLKAARVLIIGLGGLGCAASQYLAAAGVGHLTLVDVDRVELSNLHRQVLHGEDQLGAAKVESARQRLQTLNSLTSITTLNARLDDAEMAALLTQHQLVVDCCDNLATREQLNRLCFANRTPLVSGAAIRMEAQLSVFRWGADEPCYRCISRLTGNANLSCAETGVMSPLVGVTGALQAMEAIRCLSGYGAPQPGKLLLYDAMTLEFRTLKVAKDARCEVCGGKS